MEPMLVLYATTEGHTRHVAEHVGEQLIEHGVDVKVVDVRSASRLELSDFSAAVLASPIHAFHHDRALIRFVKEHRAALDKLPTAFLSISLTEAAVESPETSELKRKDAEVQLGKQLETFFAETGWKPGHVEPVAGALLFSQAGFLKRLLLKAIAKSSNLDSTKDQVFTNWAALDTFVESFAMTWKSAAR